MMYRRLFAIPSFILCAVVNVGYVYAQEGDVAQQASEPVVQQEGVETAVSAEIPQAQDSNKPASDKGVASETAPYSLAKFPSLFFTYWQHEAIKEAKNSRGFVKPPTQAELDAMAKEGEDGVKDPGVRELALGGIVYEGKDKWTIWLNETRITPNAIPKEVLDLQVFKDYIEVKWLDEATSQIFPIRLRAHERFNLDMRIFLPG